jgi:prolyl 4-hydroxylase
LVQSFWNRNKENWKPENWPEANTYVNHWKSPTYMVSVEDAGLRGGGGQLKQAIWDAAKSTISEWTNQELTEVSLYGIRVYTEGAMLNTHVDRLPLVSSAILNVAQDVDEPWPLEVIGRDGKAYNVTMEPGDMILYESHSILHGRPFPLKGRFMANLFVHFEPNGHSLRHHNLQGDDNSSGDVNQQYREALQQGTGGHEATVAGELPPYLIPNSPEESNYRQNHPELAQTGSRVTLAHTYAAAGKAEELIQLIHEQNHLIHAKDHNGWTPLHEGARAGHIDIVKYLVEQGADIKERAQHGTGGNAIFYAFHHQGQKSAVYQFLESLGVASVEPDPEL